MAHCKPLLQIAKLKKKREAIQKSESKRNAAADKAIKKAEVNAKKAEEVFKKAVAEHVCVCSERVHVRTVWDWIEI